MCGQTDSSRKRLKRSCAGVFAMLFVVLSGCTNDRAVDVPEPVRPAKLLTVEASTNSIEISLPAVIEPAAKAEVTFQVGGALEELLVRNGQDVTKGQVLARLNQRDFRNAVAQAQAQFDSASSEFRRAERLIAQEAISRSIYEQRLSARNVARAALDSAHKSLEDATLVSPFDGVVAMVHADRFQNVSAQQSVVTIQTTGSALAVAQVPSTLVANSGRITPTDIVVILDAAPDNPIPGEFYSVSAQADPATQTFAIRFTFTPPESLLVLSGMAGSVKSTLEIGPGDGGGQRQGVSVPLQSVFSDGSGRYVWVVDPVAMTVSRRTVTLGDSVGGTLEVIDGLDAGETIVVAGVSYLHEGMKIRPYQN